MNKFNYSIIAVSVLFFVNLCFPSQKSNKIISDFGTVTLGSYNKLFDPNNPYDGILCLSENAIYWLKQQMKYRVMVQKNISWVGAFDNISINHTKLKSYLDEYNFCLNKKQRNELNSFHNFLREQLEFQQKLQFQWQLQFQQQEQHAQEQEELENSWKLAMGKKSDDLVSTENVDWNNTVPCSSFKLTSVGKAIKISGDQNW